MDTLLKIILSLGLMSLVGLVVGMIGSMVTDFRHRIFEALVGWSIAVMLGLLVMFLLGALASIWIP